MRRLMAIRMALPAIEQTKMYALSVLELSNGFMALTFVQSLRNLMPVDVRKECACIATSETLIVVKF